MTTEFNNIKREVHKRVKARTVASLIAYLRQREIALWGLNKKRGWLGKSVYLMLYKYLFAIGYSALLREISSWYPVGTNTLSHNNKKILRASRSWCKQYITIGNHAEWRIAARNQSFPKSMKTTTLWMDSSDFKLVGRRSTSRGSCSWSYKENGPAQRFMFVQDARSRFRAVYGGYSPKIDDNSFLALKRELIATSFRHGVVVADCGFTKGKTLFSHTTFITPHAKPAGRMKGNDSRGLKKLTKKQEKHNEDLRSVRARVELPYGLLKNKWKSLNSSFRDGEETQGDLVLLAAAFHNASL